MLGNVRERMDTLLSGSLLTMAYQPIVRLDSGSLVSVEALARFPAALGVTPQQWFDDAALVDQSVRLELAAVRAAVAALPHLPAGVDLHGNLSPAVLVQTSHLLLQDVPMNRLVIELTEHEAVADYALLVDALAPLRTAGAKVAIDGAGAGFAGFRHALLLAPFGPGTPVAVALTAPACCRTRSSASACSAGCGGLSQLGAA